MSLLMPEKAVNRAVRKAIKHESGYAKKLSMQWPEQL